jgi:hypothetical protein
MILRATVEFSPPLILTDLNINVVIFHHQIAPLVFRTGGAVRTSLRTCFQVL